MTGSAPDVGVASQHAPAAGGGRWWLEPGSFHWSTGAVIGSLVLIHLVLVGLTFMPAPHTGGDNAAYIALGRAILEGRYVDLYDPAAPPHTQYPPVYPALLALAMALGVKPWVGLKLLTAAASASAVALSALWADRRAGRPAALAVGLVVAVSPGVLFQSHWILSDVPFWAFTMAGLWAWEGADQGGRRRLALAAAMTLLALFTRSAGLPLVVAAALWLGVTGRRTQLGAFLAVTVPLVAAWWIRSMVVGDGVYLESFLMTNPYRPDQGTIGVLELADRAGENTVRYVWRLFPAVLTGGEGVWARWIGLGVVGAAIAGWVLQLRRPAVADLFVPLYAGLLLVWPPVWAGERFLLPLLPLLVFYAGDALIRAVRAVRPDAALPAGVALVLALIVAAGPSLREGITTGVACTRARGMGFPLACVEDEVYDFFKTAEWATLALPEDAAVVSRKPTLFYIISGRTSRMFPLSREPDSLLAAARAAGADYVVLDRIDPVSGMYAAPAVMRRPDAFCAMRTTEGGTTVLGIRVGPDSTAGTRADPGRTSRSLAFPRCPERYWAGSDSSSSSSSGEPGSKAPPSR